MRKVKTFKVRHPVYTLYTKDGKARMRLHVIYGRLLPDSEKLRDNAWINGLSSGEDKIKAGSLDHFYTDSKSWLAMWMRTTGAVRSVKSILEMEYKGYVNK